MLYNANLNDAWLLQSTFPLTHRPGCNYRKAAAFFGVSMRTVRRWFESDDMPAMARRLCLIRHNGSLTLDDDWRGFSIRNGKIYTPQPDHVLTKGLLMGTWHLIRDAKKPPEFWAALSGW